jgi:hypothetical protein
MLYLTELPGKPELDLNQRQCSPIGIRQRIKKDARRQGCGKTFLLYPTELRVLMLDPAGLEPATWRLKVDVVLPAFAVREFYVKVAATRFGKTFALKLRSIGGT